MKQQWITRQGQERLLLIFLGWGADGGTLVSDAAPSAQLHRPGYDILALWDYRNEDFDPSVLSHYREVCVVAWSFGVMEAARILGSHPIPANITLMLAVGGTPRPVDDLYGIPRAVFNGTLANLNERNLRKFYRRMFADKHSWELFQAVMPQRPLNELKDELCVLGQRATQPIPALPWTAAYIGEQDAIFPPKNQHACWTDLQTSTVSTPCAGHHPDWQSLIDHTVIDKEYVAQRFEDAATSYEDEAELQCQVASRLWTLTHKHLLPHHPIDLLEIGCGTGLLTKKYIGDIDINTLELWDIAPQNLSLCAAHGSDGINLRFKQCDAELELVGVDEESLDLIISSSTVQWFHSPARFLRNAARALRRGGILAFSTYGSGMCRELRQCGIPIRDYPGENATAWHSIPSFENIHTGSEMLVRRFDSPQEVFRHLRQSGVNALRRQPLSPVAMRHAITCYPIDAEGKAPLTFNPLYFIYRKT